MDHAAGLVRLPDQQLERVENPGVELWIASPDPPAVLLLDVEPAAGEKNVEAVEAVAGEERLDVAVDLRDSRRNRASRT
jgi:hypothetical protein